MANQSNTIDFASAIATVKDAGMLVSLCTVVIENLTQNPIGEQVDQDPVSETVIIEDVDCMIGIPTTIFDLRVGYEDRKGTLTDERLQRQVNLDGYYPNIQPFMTATVDDLDYDILSVLSDSQKTRTSLLVARVTL